MKKHQLPTDLRSPMETLLQTLLTLLISEWYQLGLRISRRLLKGASAKRRVCSKAKILTQISNHKVFDVNLRTLRKGKTRNAAAFTAGSLSCESANMPPANRERSGWAVLFSFRNVNADSYSPSSRPSHSPPIHFTLRRRSILPVSLHHSSHLCVVHRASWTIVATPVSSQAVST